MEGGKSLKNIVTSPQPRIHCLLLAELGDTQKLGDYGL